MPEPFYSRSHKDLHLVHARNHEHVLAAGIHIESLAVHSAHYNDVCEVRARVYRRNTFDAADAVDAYSHLYCAYLHGRPVASLRVTPATAGRLDCEDYFPEALVVAFRSRIASASRFCCLPDVDASLRVPRLSVEAAWIEAIRRHGSRLDIIDVHERAISYYQRLGYCLVQDSFFTHPLWGTPSHVMVFPAHRDRATPIQHVFEHLNDGLAVEDLRPFVSLAPDVRSRPAASSQEAMRVSA